MADGQMMKQMELMLGLVFRADAKATERAEPGIDAVDGARLSGQRFDKGTALTNERARFVGEGTRRLQNGDLSQLADG